MHIDHVRDPLSATQRPATSTLMRGRKVETESGSNKDVGWSKNYQCLFMCTTWYCVRFRDVHEVLYSATEANRDERREQTGELEYPSTI